jgi:hypothetical protein
MKQALTLFCMILSLGVVGCFGTGGDDDSVAELSTGVYEHEEPTVFTVAEFGFDGTGSLKGRLSLISDGTYSLQGFLTVNGGVEELLLFEGKGKYSQAGNKVTQSERLERVFQPDSSTFAPWEVPEDGSTEVSSLRNVTNASFQEYDDDDGKWITWTKI